MDLCKDMTLKNWENDAENSIFQIQIERIKLVIKALIYDRKHPISNY